MPCFNLLPEKPDKKILDWSKTNKVADNISPWNFKKS